MRAKTLHLTLPACLMLAVTLLIPSQPVQAVSGSEWQAGNIIADDIFTDKNAMSVADIQSFLNQRVGTNEDGTSKYNSTAGVCDSNGTRTSELGGGTRAQYGASQGNPTPFTCLKDYYEVPKENPSPGVPANNYGGQAIPPGAQSAAQLIWNAAQRYNISPKVLLVTIQKESVGPLITDDWPFLSQYTYAMGAHCPDSGPGGAANCDSNYAGFSIQIAESAALFRYYLDNMSQPWWPYKKLGNNTILYQNSKPECGSSVVNIITRATAALYTYTPYQPNQAALNNLYGTGDTCSAYGNRNFWRMYTNWFGYPNAPAFRATYDSQSPYPVLDSGTGVSIYFQFRNSGKMFWKDDMSTFPGYRPTHLASTSPINRVSSFRADNWLTPSRATGTFSRVYESDGVTLSPDQHTVQPSQIGRFEFTVYADPSIPGGVYREHFQPIFEGAPNYGWNMDGLVYMDIGVHRPSYKAAFHSQSPYPTINKGGSGDVFIRFKNTGIDPWLDDTGLVTGKRPVHLATSWPINRVSAFSSTWPNPSRPSYNLTKVYEADGTTLASAQHTVQPGQIGEFTFTISVPANAPSGFFQEYFEPVVEGAPGYSWNMGITAWLGVTVP